MSKTEVYSWRLSREMKVALEEAARREKLSLSGLLEQIVAEWLQGKDLSGGSEEDVVQKRLHQAASQTFGTIQGGDPYRSERARDTLRMRMKKSRAR